MFFRLHTSSCGSKTLVNISLFAPDIKSTATPPGERENKQLYFWLRCWRGPQSLRGTAVIVSKHCQGNAAEWETCYRSECHTLHSKAKKNLGIILLAGADNLATTGKLRKVHVRDKGFGIKGLSNVKHQLITSSRWLNTSRVDDWRVPPKIVVPIQDKMNPCQMQLIKQRAVACHCCAEMFAMCKLNECVQTFTWWTWVF